MTKETFYDTYYVVNYVRKFSLFHAKNSRLFNVKECQQDEVSTELFPLRQKGRK